MVSNILILANENVLANSSGFDQAFRPIGEFVDEVSQLYTILKERTVDLILIPEIYPKISRGVVRRMRLRNPMADIWQVVWSGTVDVSADEIYDGTININDGAEQIKNKVQRILRQK